MNSCIITGGDLVLHNEGMVVHGDLHVKGGSYIFNSVLDVRGEALRNEGDYIETMSSNRMCIDVSSNNCFERRGIFVFSGTDAYPNQAALIHIRRGEQFGGGPIPFGL